MHTPPAAAHADEPASPIEPGRSPDDPGEALELIDDPAGVRVIVLHGEHDVSSAAALRLALFGARRAGLAVVVELSFASFIDSTILGAIVGALRDCREDGRGFALVASSDGGESVPRLLEITGMRAVFPVFEDRPSAVERAAAGRAAAVTGAEAGAD